MSTKDVKVEANTTSNTMPLDSRDISPHFPIITTRRRSRPPSYNTAIRGDQARSPRLRFEERGTPSRQIAYNPPYVQTVSNSSSSSTRDSHRTRAAPEHTPQPTMEEDDRMRITPSELDEMDARALASISHGYPHAPRPPRSRTSPTIGSNSYLSSSYMNDTATRTLSSLDSTLEFFSLPPHISPSRFQARHRQPNNNYSSTHPRLLPTPIRPARTFTHILDPVLRDDSLFSLPGIDSLEDEDPYLRDSAGQPHYASAPGTYEDIHPLPLSTTYARPYSAAYHTAPHRRSRGFAYDHRHDYHDHTRWDPRKRSELAGSQQRPAVGTYRWSHPAHDEMPDVEDADECEKTQWPSSSRESVNDAGDFERYGNQQGRSGRGDSPPTRRRGNVRFSTRFEGDGMDQRGETVVEVKTAGGTVVKVKRAGRSRDRGYL